MAHRLTPSEVMKLVVNDDGRGINERRARTLIDAGLLDHIKFGRRCDGGPLNPYGPVVAAGPQGT